MSCVDKGSDCVCLCACVHQEVFSIWGYCESRATFTLIGKCPNSKFWRALTIGLSSLLIPTSSHTLKRNIIYMDINTQRCISCGELKAETSDPMDRQVVSLFLSVTLKYSDVDHYIFKESQCFRSMMDDWNGPQSQLSHNGKLGSLPRFFFHLKIPVGW